MIKRWAFYFIMLSCACQESVKQVSAPEVIRFKEINYFRGDSTAGFKMPFKYRYTYYFNDGIPYRWIELDSLGVVLTDYIYDYDDAGIQVGAWYKEPGENSYAREIVTFPDDSTRVTEWVDSSNSVYYTMIDNLNKHGKSYRATFQGNEVHGYDSTFYTNEGFIRRIFFTNVAGKVMNDRSFVYDSVHGLGEWLQRKKIMNDTIREIQKRSIYVDSYFTSQTRQYYPGIISTGDWDENVITFSKGGERVFFTRTKGWDHQTGHLLQLKNGTYSVPLNIPELDMIYNGSISPGGHRIIYCVKSGDGEDIWLAEETKDAWKTQNISVANNIRGGYFNWMNEEQLYFYMSHGNGDIVSGKLQGDHLEIVDSLYALNTIEGTEFSPYVDKQGAFLIFTRYLERDEAQQGFFISYNAGNSEQPKWSEPNRIEDLPYGWSAYISDDYQRFIYTDGEDIYSVPVDGLSVSLR